VTERDDTSPPASPAPAAQAAPDAAPKGLTVIGAAFLGVGAMVGAGIFALLGQAGAVAGSAVWISFLLAGAIAGLLSYVVVKLGVRYPSRGGFVTYLVKAFGNGHMVGITSWLLYFVVIIVTSMVAVSFGAYGTSLFFGDDAASYWDNVLTCLVVIGMAIVNLFGASMVAKAQSAIVWVLLVVFAGFAVVTLSQMDLDLLSPSGYPSVTKIIASVALTFFAYLGFSVITFTAGDLKDPARELPRAMNLALAITVTLYVAVSLGVFGTLTVDEVIEHGDTALAEAARPVLGDAGFTIMAVAALLATASSVNSNLFAAGGLTLTLSELTQFPPIFGRPGYFRGTRGVTITVILVLILANGFDLSAIASLGSAVSLVVFLVVGLAGLRLRAETGSQAWVIVLTMAATAVVLLLFAIDTARNAPETFTAMIVMAALAVVLDVVWKRVRTTAPTATPTSQPS
jgi:amino acid transporter